MRSFLSIARAILLDAVKNEAKLGRKSITAKALIRDREPICYFCNSEILLTKLLKPVERRARGG